MGGLLSASAAYGSSAFQVEGSLHAAFYYASGELRATQSTRFIVAVDGDQWAIRHGYEVTTCDGTNVYAVLLVPDEPKVPATIVPGWYPLQQSYQTTIPWLAFCSARFLEDKDRVVSMPAPWGLAMMDVSTHAYTASVSCFADPPGLPRAARFVTTPKSLARAARSNALRVEGVSAGELERRRLDLEKRLGRNQLGGEYMVRGTTNYNGLTIPTDFELRHFAVRPVASKSRSRPPDNASSRGQTGSSHTYLAALYLGHISRVCKPTTTDYLPHMTNYCDVVDHRFSDRRRHIDYIGYTITNGVWLPTNNAWLCDLFKAKQERKPVVEGIWPRHLVALAILAMVIALPPVVFAVRWYRQKTNENVQRGEP